MSPPSRGRRNAGAFAPSIKADLGAGDSVAFFGCFDEALCGVFERVLPTRLATLLPVLAAAAGRVLEGAVLGDVAGFRADVLTEGAFGNFLRVFLGIRLPFVVFGRSIIGLLRALPLQAGIGSCAGQL